MTVRGMSFLGQGVVLSLLLLLSAERVAAQLPRAKANDHRTTAGRMVDGELRVSLEAVVAEWRPRGEDPVLTAAVFAEQGGVPMAPGPMIRVAAGTPVRVTIRNTLDRPIAFGGLGDRGGPPVANAPEDDPAFLRATYFRLEPGQSREVRLTPSCWRASSATMTSFCLRQTAIALSVCGRHPARTTRTARSGKGKG